jgi:hypothetical protein
MISGRAWACADRMCRKCTPSSSIEAWNWGSAFSRVATRRMS